MAGRGRGRGRGAQFSFDLDALGISRGELPSWSPGRQHSTDFPPLQQSGVPLPDETPEQRRLLEIKQELRRRFQQSPYFLKLDEKKRDIERYSDRYQQTQKEGEMKWTPDWSMFPSELRPKKKRTRKIVHPKLKAAGKTTSEASADVLSRLENMETAVTEENVEVKEEEDDEEENKEQEEEGEEEEFDEDEPGETDYGLNYFDNGEGYGDDDDEDDEPTYS